VTVEEIDTLGFFIIFCPNLLQPNQIFLIFAASISFIKNKKRKNKKIFVTPNTPEQSFVTSPNIP
jgi:hypothetical protein